MKKLFFIKVLLFVLCFVLPFFIHAQSEKRIDVKKIQLENLSTVGDQVVEQTKEKKESAVLKLNPQEWQELVRSHSLQESLDSLLRIEKIIAGESHNDTTALLDCFIGTLYYDLKQYDQAIYYCERSLSIDPLNLNTNSTLGLTFLKLAEKSTGEKSDSLYTRAIERYSFLAEHSTNKSDVYLKIGNVYLSKGKINSNQRNEQYASAIEYYQKAIDEDPSNANAYFNWSVVLIELGGNAEDPEISKDYYQNAILKIEKAEQYKYHMPELYHNWGGVCYLLGNLSFSSEADSLYREGIGRFKYTMHLIESEDSKLCDECYANVLMSAINYWGVTQARLAVLDTHNERKRLFDQAIANCERAVNLGASSYYLGCVYALKGEADMAFHYLEETLRTKTQTFEDVEKDTNWDGLRTHELYIELINGCKEK